MMGSPYYYEVHFDPIDVVFHDCMWSGSCCIQLVQQPPETVVQQQTEQQRPSVGEHLAHRISLASSSHGPPFKQQSSPQACKPPPAASPEPARTQQDHTHSQPSKRLDSTSSSSSGGGGGGGGGSGSSTSSSSSESSFELEVRREPLKQTRQQARQHAAKQHHPHLQRKQRDPKLATGDNSTTNNKKLRHREVEKNRHRQLQAMVKTLSDRIPGKIDKETQVQTMRRAARYCLYLRDVLSHGPPVSKDKLERIYSKCCENVDSLMSSN